RAALQAEDRDHAVAATDLAQAEHAPVEDLPLRGRDVDVGHAEDARAFGRLLRDAVEEFQQALGAIAVARRVVRLLGERHLGAACEVAVQVGFLSRPAGLGGIANAKNASTITARNTTPAITCPTGMPRSIVGATSASFGFGLSARWNGRKLS